MSPLKLVAAFLILTISGYSQTVQVFDTLYNANGTLASGRITITTGTPFQAPDGTAVGLAPVQVTIPAAGTINVSLYPNVGATPSGTSYRAQYVLNSGAQYFETWVVPGSGPVDLADVRVNTIPSPTVLFSPSQARAVDTPADEECLTYEITGTIFEWQTCGSGGGSGLLTLNGLTADPQLFAVGTAGADFGISSASDTHTFNLPSASGTNRGALISADWTTFNNKQPALSTSSAVSNQFLTGFTAPNTFTRAAIASGDLPSHNAATATALAANGSNCSAGSFPLGVDASGASETCTALPTTISGTANQITASAATGPVTLSIPTNPTLPGTTTGTFSGNLTGNVTGNVSGSSGSTTGNAATATALAANPTDCAAGAFANSIDAEGDLTCIAPNAGTDVTTDLEEETHVTEHAENGADELLIENMGTACAENEIPKANATGGIACAADATGGSPTFDQIGSGTNTSAAMVVGSGASLRSAAGILGIPNSTTLPMTCTVGDAYFDNNGAAGARFYLCTATDTWTAMDNPFGTAIDAAEVAADVATQAEIDLKAPLASPTFTGTVTIPTPFTLGAVSVLPTGTELNFVDGVTSAIQTQLDTKITASSSDALTNKDIDCEATGNVCTITNLLEFIAGVVQNSVVGGQCSKDPTLAYPAGTDASGTNTGYATLSFDAATDEGLGCRIWLPTGFTGTVDADIFWRAAATSGDVIWAIQTICVADAETGDPAFNTASTVTDTAKGTTLQFNTAAISTVTITGCAANEIMMIRFYRDANAAGDSLSGDAQLLSFRLTTRRDI